MLTSSCAGFRRSDRRQFLRIGGTGFFGLTLSGLLRGQVQAASGRTSPAKHMILVWLGGGPPHQDTFDMKPDAPAEFRGEFKPIATNVPGIEICELMPRLARLADKYAIIRSCSIGDESWEHSGGLYWLTGNPRRATGTPKFPSYGNVLSQQRPAPAAVPTFVDFGSEDRFQTYGLNYLGSATEPLRFRPDDPRSEVRSMLVPQLDVTGLERRQELFTRLNRQLRDHDALAPAIAGLDEFTQKGFDLLRSSKLREALDLQREPARSADRYGKKTYGKQVLAARRLVEAGVPCVWLGFGLNGNWDHHSTNFKQCREKLPDLDLAVASLLEDLDARGLLDTTIVAVLGEMGRTPRINKEAGRDHWGTTQAVFVAGSGFKGGTIVGATDKVAGYVTEKKYKVESFGRTIYTLLGIDPSQELYTTTNRPMKIILEDAPLIRDVLVSS